GALSAKNLATDGNGIATFVYKAPEAVDSADRNTMVTIKVTPQSGDGSGGITGRTASHQYRDAGTFSATLTVTDTGGSKGSRSKSVVVGTSGDPVAGFVYSPSDPGIGEAIVFNGSPSTAVSPRTIVSYQWQFGTDRSGSGMIVSKTYD